MKLTTAQAALLHVVESAASSAILTLIVGIIQQLSTHTLNIAELGTIFGSGLLAAFGLVYKSVKTDPSLPQAEADTKAQAQEVATSLAGQLWQSLKQELGVVESRLHIHINDAMAASTQQPSTPIQPVVTTSGNASLYTAQNSATTPSSTPQVAFPPLPAYAPQPQASTPVAASQSVNPPYDRFSTANYLQAVNVPTQGA